MKKLVIATRGSRLALRQAEHIRQIIQNCPGLQDLSTELLIVKTKGDLILDTPLSKMGGKGLFVKEIEEALLDGRADLAVHSCKDLPVDLPDGLALGAIPEREAPEDALLSCRYAGLEDLPAGARVGTSSLRRQAQLLALRPDLCVLSLRGNIDTRLQKLQRGDFDAIVVAKAGLRRLGISAPREQILPLDLFLPAVGQGALGLELLWNNKNLIRQMAFLDHAPTRCQISAERAFLAKLEGGCQTPIAAHCRLNTDSLILDGLVASPDGRRIIRKQISGPVAQAAELGRELAGIIISSGGAAILRDIGAP